MNVDAHGEASDDGRAGPFGWLMRQWRRPHLAWFLLAPHVFCATSFAAGIAIVLGTGTNRLSVDHALGTAGFSLFVAAVPSSALALAHTVFSASAARPRWPVVLAHLMGLPIALAIGVLWIGFHLA